MKRLSRISYLILTTAFVLVFWRLSLAETTPENITSGIGNKTNNEHLVVKTVGGLRFAVPEDMPIQKKDGGIVAAMKLEEYAAMKFSNLESRLSSIEEAVTKITEELSMIQKNLDSMRKPVLISDSKQDNPPTLKDLKE